MTEPNISIIPIEHLKSFINGILVREWDSINKIVTEYNEDGSIKSTRPFNEDEERIRQANANLNLMQEIEETIQSQILTQISEIRTLIGPGDAAAGRDTLNAIINTPNPTINSSPAQYIVGLARIVRQIARAEIRTSRIVAHSLSEPATD